MWHRPKQRIFFNVINLSNTNLNCAFSNQNPLWIWRTKAGSKWYRNLTPNRIIMLRRLLISFFTTYYFMPNNVRYVVTRSTMWYYGHLIMSNLNRCPLVIIKTQWKLSILKTSTNDFIIIRLYSQTVSVSYYQVLLVIVILDLLVTNPLFRVNKISFTFHFYIS